MDFVRRARARARRGASKAPTASPPADLVDRGHATARGGRESNQDRSAVSASYGVLSDGAGGHEGGELAAELCLAATTSTLRMRTGPADEAVVREAARRANTVVHTTRWEEPTVASMAATLSVAALAELRPEESEWVVATVGDSPAWVVRVAAIERLSAERSVAAELVCSGTIGTDDADRHPGHNVLTRAIGVDAEVEPDIRHVTLAPGEALLLASDGLTEQLGTDVIHTIVATAPTAGEAATALVQHALDLGTHDNVTAVVLRHVRSAPYGPGRCR
ncbi:MAG: PP2C family serine/threonine-protein phosphatase [Actinomycetota bacterium]|nr:PP2C family serine/threonine-protein phosphatase [Actinomycetota bacterium]